MKNKIVKLSIILFICLISNGCFKKDNMENITIYTSVYPVEFLVNTLYGSNSKVVSIYPDGAKYNQYNLSKKLLNDYSKADLFVYNSSINKEKTYALSINNKLIDSASGINYNYDPAELWLSPSNMLMMAQNIKNGLNEYVSEYYLIKDINNKYNKINLELSEIDSELKAISDNSSSKTIVASSDLFKYLEKYGITVISLEENENLNDKVISNAKKLISSGEIKYIFIKDDEQINLTLKNILDSYPKLNVINFNTLSTISSLNRNEQKDYISIMNDNIDLLKKELYN